VRGAPGNGCPYRDVILLILETWLSRISRRRLAIGNSDTILRISDNATVICVHPIHRRQKNIDSITDRMSSFSSPTSSENKSLFAGTVNIHSHSSLTIVASLLHLHPFAARGTSLTVVHPPWSKVFDEFPDLGNLFLVLSILFPFIVFELTGSMSCSERRPFMFFLWAYLSNSAALSMP